MISSCLILPVCCSVSSSIATSLLKFLFSCAALLVTAFGVSFISADPADLLIHMLSTLKFIPHSLTTSCLFCLPPAPLPLLLPSDFLLHSKCCCGGHHLYIPLTAPPSYARHLILSLTFPSGDVLVICKMCLKEIFQLKHTHFILACLSPSEKLMV